MASAAACGALARIPVRFGVVVNRISRDTRAVPAPSSEGRGVHPTPGASSANLGRKVRALTPLRAGGRCAARQGVPAGSLPGRNANFHGVGQISLRHRRDPAYAAVVRLRYKQILRPYTVASSAAAGGDMALPHPNAATAAAAAGYGENAGGFEQPRERIDAASSSADDDEQTVDIPISFYSILNLSPARAAPAAIEAAYTGVMQRELVDGFSQSCLAARADLVDAAAQVISDPTYKAEHESDLKNGRLTPVPVSQLGGALALMQEAVRRRPDGPEIAPTLSSLLGTETSLGTMRRAMNFSRRATPFHPFRRPPPPRLPGRPSTSRWCLAGGDP